MLDRCVLKIRRINLFLHMRNMNDNAICHYFSCMSKKLKDIEQNGLKIDMTDYIKKTDVKSDVTSSNKILTENDLKTSTINIDSYDTTITIDGLKDKIATENYVNNHMLTLQNDSIKYAQHEQYGTFNFNPDYYSKNAVILMIWNLTYTITGEFSKNSVYTPFNVNITLKENVLNYTMMIDTDVELRWIRHKLTIVYMSVNCDLRNVKVSYKSSVLRIDKTSLNTNSLLNDPSNINDIHGMSCTNKLNFEYSDTPYEYITDIPKPVYINAIFKPLYYTEYVEFSARIDESHESFSEDNTYVKFITFNDGILDDYQYRIIWKLCDINNNKYVIRMIHLSTNTSLPFIIKSLNIINSTYIAKLRTYNDLSYYNTKYNYILPYNFNVNYNSSKYGDIYNSFKIKENVGLIKLFGTYVIDDVIFNIDIILDDSHVNIPRVYIHSFDDGVSYIEYNAETFTISFFVTSTNHKGGFKDVNVCELNYAIEDRLVLKSEAFTCDTLTYNCGSVSTISLQYIPYNIVNDVLVSSTLPATHILCTREKQQVKITGELETNLNSNQFIIFTHIFNNVDKDLTINEPLNGETLYNIKWYARLLGNISYMITITRNHKEMRLRNINISYELRKEETLATHSWVNTQLNDMKTRINTQHAGLFTTNTTITHYAPVSESDINNYKLGYPVFMSGLVYKYVNNEWKEVSNSDTTDCICSVKTNGTYKEFVGIIVSIDVDNNCVTFATHGDYLFHVDSSNNYKIGDVITYDGNVVDDEITMTVKLSKSIIGKVSSIIDNNTIAVFKD